MRFVLTINCDNVAFYCGSVLSPSTAADEVARILKDAAAKVELIVDHGPLLDGNGNTVGGFGFK